MIRQSAAAVASAVEERMKGLGSQQVRQRIGEEVRYPLRVIL